MIYVEAGNDAIVNLDVGQRLMVRGVFNDVYAASGLGITPGTLIRTTRSASVFGPYPVAGAIRIHAREHKGSYSVESLADSVLLPLTGAPSSSDGNANGAVAINPGAAPGAGLFVKVGDTYVSTDTLPVNIGAVGTAPRRHKKPGLQRLALFDKAANVGGGSAGNCSDLTLPAFEPFTGDTHVVFTVPAASTYRFSQAAVLSTPIDMTLGAIHLSMIPSVDSSVAISASAIVIELYSAGTPASPGTKFISADVTTALKAQISTPGRHGCFGVSVSEINTLNGGALLTDKTAVLFVMVRFTFPAGSIGGKMAIGAIDYVPNGGTKTKVIFGFDDAYRASTMVALSIMDKAGMPGVLYPDPLALVFNGSTSGRLSPADIDMLVSKGWQVASQRYSSEGDSASMPDDLWASYTAANISLRRQMGWPGGEDGSWYGGTANPFNNTNGLSNDSTVRKAKAARRLYRTVRQYLFGPAAYSETWPFTDPMAIRSFGFNAFGNFTAGNVGTGTMSTLTKARDSKGVAFFTLHGELDNSFNNNQTLTDANVAAFQAIVTEIVNNPTLYEVVTLSDLATL